MATKLPHDAMAQLFNATAANDLPDVPNYNVCPTDPVQVVTAADGHRRLRPMRWGFVPHWYKKPNGGPLLINARSETIAEKPAFRDACRARRCLILASGFFEWKRSGDATPLPWYVTRSDAAPMVFGGIWQDWEKDGVSLTTCAIVTTDANADMAPIHHRLPLVLEAADWGKWLGENGKGAASLMQPAPLGLLSFQAVSTQVNSNRACGPDLIAPVIR